MSSMPHTVHSPTVYLRPPNAYSLEGADVPFFSSNGLLPYAGGQFFHAGCEPSAPLPRRRPLPASIAVMISRYVLFFPFPVQRAYRVQRSAGIHRGEPPRSLAVQPVHKGAYLDFSVSPFQRFPVLRQHLHSYLVRRPIVGGNEENE